MAGKYRNVSTIVDGISFDSAAEALRYRQLAAMESAGLISDLKLQVPFVLVPNQKKANGKHERKCVYFCDFSYQRNGARVVEDVKSKATKTPLYVLKRKLMLMVFGIEIQEVS